MARNRSPGVCQIWGNFRAYHKFCRGLDRLNLSPL